MTMNKCLELKKNNMAKTPGKFNGKRPGWRVPSVGFLCEQVAST